MGFMGIMFGVIAIIIFLTIIIFMIVFAIVAVILKIYGKKKDNRILRIIGNVCLILSVLSAIPVVLVIAYVIFTSAFDKVSLPNGSTAYVSVRDVTKMRKLAENGSDEAIAQLNRLLNRSENLVYYHDINRKSILDYGLESGNAGVVYTAINHGVLLDNPERYAHMSYVDNSMEFYIKNIIGRGVTNDDIEIIKLLFEQGASTEYKKDSELYSNMLGIATWSVLYNDERVTNTEIEFIQVFIDNGITTDRQLILWEDVPGNYYFSSEFHGNVVRDDNYYVLMETIGR